MENLVIIIINSFLFLLFLVHFSQILKIIFFYIFHVFFPYIFLIFFVFLHLSCPFLMKLIVDVFLNLFNIVFYLL